jgi:hypothetical protein
LALAIGLFTGVRRSDAIRLGPQMGRGGWLHFGGCAGQILSALLHRREPRMIAVRFVCRNSSDGDERHPR